MKFGKTVRPKTRRSVLFIYLLQLFLLNGFLCIFLLRDSENDLLYMKHDALENQRDICFLLETTFDASLPCTTDGSVEKQKCCRGVPFYILADSLFSVIILSHRIFMWKSRGIHKAASRHDGCHIYVPSSFILHFKRSQAEYHTLLG